MTKNFKIVQVISSMMVNKGMISRNKSVIRFENVGCIIWSSTLKKYFFMEKRVGALFEENLLLKKQKISDAGRAIMGLWEELEKIGVDDDSDIIVNSNKTQRKLYAPLECYFDFTTKCNLRCRDCYNSKNLGNASMDIDTIKSIIQDLNAVGVKRIFVAGGEPTLEMEKLEAYIDTAYSLGMLTSVATNGTILTEDICRYLLSRELFDISVSIDGWDEKSNSIRRSANSFELAKNGVMRLVRLKKEIGAETEICVKPIVDRTQSVDFFENMIALTRELGADKVKFANPERSLNHELGHYGQNVRKYYENINLIQSLKEKYEGIVAITNGTNPCIGFGLVGIKGMKGCIGAQELLAINGDGRITPCLMNHKVLGNIYDYKSLIDFFDTTDQVDSFLSAIKYKECYDCELYLNCRGGCQVRKIVQRGKMEGRDPLCPIENGISLDKVCKINDEILTPIRVVHSL